MPKKSKNSIDSKKIRKTKLSRIPKDSRSIEKIKDTLELKDYSEMDSQTLSEYCKILRGRIPFLTGELTPKADEIFNKHVKGAFAALSKL